jgi:YaiO family outer membrane protein
MPGPPTSVARGCLVAALIALPAFSLAQSTTPWAVDIGRERAEVTNNGAVSIWTTDRAQVGWTRPDVGGWFGSIERQERGERVDVAVSTRGYRRAGDWTVGFGVAISPHAEFLYRYSADAEVSRRVAGTLVASAGYRYLAYRPFELHQVQPSLAWYHPKGDLQARFFLTRNADLDRTSPTMLVRTTFDAHPRVRVGGGAAVGDRIFDVTLLPIGSAQSRVAFASVRFGFTAHDAIEVGGWAAHEDPGFDFRSLSVGYRRMF